MNAMTSINLQSSINLGLPYRIRQIPSEMNMPVRSDFGTGDRDLQNSGDTILSEQFSQRRAEEKQLPSIAELDQVSKASTRNMRRARGSNNRHRPTKAIGGQEHSGKSRNGVMRREVIRGD